MSDGLKSHIRTWWPIALGQLATLIVAYLAAKTGVHISGELAYAVVSAVVTALVYSLGRWLEIRRGDSWPASVARGLGRFILSLGLDVGQPSYPDKPAASSVRPIAPQSWR